MSRKLKTSVLLCLCVLILVLCAVGLSSCNQIYNVMHSHVYKPVEIVDATCTSEGYTKYECTCEGPAREMMITTPKLPHTEVEGEAVSPTCTEDGRTAGFYCSSCNQPIEGKGSEVIPATGHTEVIDPAVHGDCTNHGLSEGSHCAVCDTVLVVQVAVIGPHTEVVDAATPAGCESTGLTEGSHCSICNDIIVAQNVIPATGHTEVIDPAVVGDCLNPGLSEGSHCSTCGTVIVAQHTVHGDHTEIADAAKAPDCENTGLTEGSHCSLCGEILLAQEVIPALGHSPVADSAKAPDCLNTGLTEGSHCSTCDKVLVAQDVVPALGHASVTDNAKAPDCLNTGLTEGSHCDRCGDTLVAQNIVPALGHSAVTDSAKAPDCLNTGLTEGSHCDRCGDTLVAQNIVPALGHSVVTDNAKAPDCLNTGLTEGSHCDRCGEILVAQDVVPALGHAVVTDNAKAPDCVNTGLTEGSHCERCEAILVPQQIVPANGHSFSENWFYNESGHYHSCHCGASSEFGEHISSGTATATEPESCTVCGYIITPLTGIVIDELPFNGDTYVGRVVGTADAYSFADIIRIFGDTDFKVYADEELTCELGKSVSLAHGDNLFFIAETHDGALNVYRVEIYRAIRYTVSFVSEGYLEFASITVDEGTVIDSSELPETYTPGYDFAGWDHDFSTPITSDLTATATWTPSTNTPYYVYHRIELLEGGWTTHSVEELSGTTGSTVAVSPIEIEHYTLDPSLSSLEVTVGADGMTQVMLYYTRNYYSVSISEERAGTVTVGSFKYGSRVTLTTESFVGFKFLGWFIGDMPVSTALTATVTVNGPIVAKYELISELQGFDFVSDKNSCTLNGVENKDATEVVIPDCVTSIAPDAFKDMTSLERVEIPEEVTEIGSGAFAGCSADIVFAANSKITSIGDGAFAGYAGDIIALPDSVKEIGCGAFSGTDAIVKWSSTSKLETVGEGAFSGYLGDSVILPAGIKEIKENAFSNCESVTDIFFMGNSGIWGNVNLSEDVGGFVLTINLYFFASSDPYNEVADSWHFDKNGNVVIYPAHTHTVVIDREVLPGCESTGLTEGSHCSVCNKTLVAQKTVPATGHTKVTVPGYDATCTATGLSDEVSCSVCGKVITPATVIAMKSHSYGTDGMCTVCGMERPISDYLNFEWVRNGSYYRVSAKNVNSLPAHLVIPAYYEGYPVKEIKANGFQRTVGVRYVEIPDTVTTIGSNAFYNSSSISAICIPSSVIAIQSGALAGCSSITVYTEHSSAPSGWASNWNSSNRPVYYGFDDIGVSDDYVWVKLGEEVRIAAYMGDETGKLIIPSRLGGYDVTAIGSFAFTGTCKATSIVIPETVTKLYSRAFAGCSSTVALIVPDSVASAEQYAIATCAKMTVMLACEQLPEGFHNTWQSGCRNVLYGIEDVVDDEMFVYSVKGGEATAVYYLQTAGTNIIIPNEAGGYPVTALADALFKAANGSSALVSVTVPDSVKYIGKECFRGCTKLEEITLPEGITEIKNYTFYDCRALKSIDIPDSVEVIGEFAFRDCKALVSVELPDSLVNIGNNAFGNCTSLAALSRFPEGLESIGSSAFYYCHQLKDVYLLPTTLATVKEYAFDSVQTNFVTALTERPAGWHADAFRNSQLYFGVVGSGETADGFEYLETAGGNATITGFNGDATNLVIPSEVDGLTVTSIAAWAFKENRTIVNLTLPDTLTEIRYLAFDGCTSIRYIIVPESVKVLEGYSIAAGKVVVFMADELPENAEVAIGTRPYYVGIDEVIIDGDSLYVRYGNELTLAVCFGESIDLVIPGSVNGYAVTAIGEKALMDVNAETLVISEGVASLGNNVFANMLNLKDITLPDSLRTLGNKVFYNCDSLEVLVIPDGVEEIGTEMLYGCDWIRSLTVPFLGPKAVYEEGDRVYPIGYFFGTDTYEIRSYYQITQYHHAYGNESATQSFKAYAPGALAEVILTKGAPTKYAFAGLKNLTRVTLPDDITRIPSNAFKDCQNLSWVNIPDSVTEICNSAFGGCSSLVSIDLPDGLTSIEGRAFSECTSLKSIEIPAGIKNLNSYTFEYCYALESIILPDELEYIGRFVFSYAGQNVSGVRYLYIPEGVKKIETDAFSNTYISTIYFGGEKADIELWCDVDYESEEHGRYVYGVSRPVVLDDGTIYAINSLGELILIRYPYDIDATEVTVSDEIDGKPVVHIGELFSSNSKLTKVTLPETLKSIGYSCFAYCYNLAEINFPASLEQIGSYAFANCYDLTSVELGDKVAVIGASAFRSCSGITEFAARGVRVIGNSAFSYCSSLVCADFGMNVTRIDAYAFSDCNHLEYIYIPSGAQFVGYGAFAGCSSIRIECAAASLPTEWHSNWNYNNYPVSWGVAKD